MTLSLGTITQGERGTITFVWDFPVTSPATIQAATITAVMRHRQTGDVTAVTGTLTGTTATTVTWALSEGDSGTSGVFSVVFKAVVSGTNTFTLAATLTIADNPAVTAVQNPPLVGVSLAEAEFLFDFYTVTTAAALGEIAKSDGAGGIAFSAVGSGSDVADLTTAGLDAGDMFRVAGAGGLESQTPAQVLTNIDGAASGHDHDADYDAAGAAAAAQAGAQSYADSAVSTHEADTTNVHGIVDTSALLDSDDIGVSVANTNEYIVIACGDESSDLAVALPAVTFRMPYAMTLTAVRASVATAPTGSTLQVDINESGSTILSTKLTIDAGELTSETAAVPAVISDSALADDAEITIDIDAVGSSVAGVGLKVTLIGTRP